MKTDTRILSTDGFELHIHYRCMSKGTAAPTIVFSHGFSVDGMESHRMFLNMADVYHLLGYTTVQFDYRGCGYSDGDFSDFTVTGAVEDLHTVLNWTLSQDEVEPSKVLIHGQSLGTAVATIGFYDSEEIVGFVLWNLSANLYVRYKEMLGEDLLKNGITCISGKGLFVKDSYLEDIKQYDVVRYFDSFTKPVLLLNSGADTKGDPSLADDAYKRLGNLGTRIIIPGANHSFKCQPKLEKEAVKATVKWVERIFEK